EALAQHALAGREDVLLVRVRDRLELGRRQVREERELAEGVCDAHAPLVSQWPGARWSRRSLEHRQPDGCAVAVAALVGVLGREPELLRARVVAVRDEDRVGTALHDQADVLPL